MKKRGKRKDVINICNTGDQLGKKELAKLKNEIKTESPNVIMVEMSIALSDAEALIKKNTDGWCLDSVLKAHRKALLFIEWEFKPNGTI